MSVSWCNVATAVSCSIGGSGSQLLHQEQRPSACVSGTVVVSGFIGGSSSQLVRRSQRQSGDASKAAAVRWCIYACGARVHLCMRGSRQSAGSSGPVRSQLLQRQSADEYRGKRGATALERDLRISPATQISIHNAVWTDLALLASLDRTTGREAGWCFSCCLALFGSCSALTCTISVSTSVVHVLVFDGSACTWWQN